MSWGEVEKINSWAKKGVPLNHLIWLNDYKTYGEKSYVYKDKDILHELYRSPISANDENINTEAFEYIACEMEPYLCLWLSKNYGLRDLTNLPNCNSVSEIIEQTDILNRIFISDFCSSFFKQYANLLVGQDTYHQTIAVNTAALIGISSNDANMTLLESSDSFKTAVASNPDVQTISTSVTTTLENVFAISATAYVASGYATAWNGTGWGCGSVKYIPHGSTEEITAITQKTQNSALTTESVTINKFAKSLTIGAGWGSPNTEVTYIQLDNVV